MNQKNIKEYIRALEHISKFLKTLLDEENNIIPEPADTLSEFTQLRMLSKSEVWPEAVPKDLICGDTEEEKNSRAIGIIDEFITGDIEGQNFLDFGCGEGHIANLMPKIKSVGTSVGYDLKNQGWEKFKDTKNLTMTTNLNDVVKLGPYDLILVNDVLDHSKTPKEDLNRLRGIKRPHTGKIILRVHPWTSRHGTHLYKTLNKAYLHIIFTDEELLSMGLEGLNTLKIIDPIGNYKKMFKEVGFTVLKEEITTQPMEIFFTRTPEILRRIKSRWRNSEIPELASGAIFPREILEMQFIDFTLI